MTSAGSVLSSGEQKGVLLSRALLTHPRLLLLDDSLGCLSEESLCEVLEQVFEPESRPTIVSTSPVPQVVLRCDRVIVLDKGRIVEEGPPLELASRPDGQLQRFYPTLCVCLKHLKGEV